MVDIVLIQRQKCECHTNIPGCGGYEIQSMRDQSIFLRHWYYGHISSSQFQPSSQLWACWGHVTTSSLCTLSCGHSLPSHLYCWDDDRCHGHHHYCYNLFHYPPPLWGITMALWLLWWVYVLLFYTLFLTLLSPLFSSFSFMRFHRFFVWVYRQNIIKLPYVVCLVYCKYTMYSVWDDPGVHRGPKASFSCQMILVIHLPFCFSLKKKRKITPYTLLTCSERYTLDTR